MTISAALSDLTSIFIDTAPVIYYIEAHPEFGPVTKEVVTAFQSGRLTAFSSVITLTEVLPKPIENGDEKLAKKFSEFLKHGKNLVVLEISEKIAEKAGKLRGHYTYLRTIDAIQIASAIEAGADAFLTNDKKLKQVKEIKTLVLADYL
ncbi:MAG: PIN domain-containing protein [Nitrospirae bacterium]|nr:PIN domain-containing protein [Nitrospirota bacterium]